jgi:hypothetical protein
MQQGSPSAYAGSGIYFATTPGATDWKASKKGVILSCKVELGRVRVIDAPGNWSPGLWRLLYGYDSIKIASLYGIEYVVFDPNRVKNIRIHWNSPQPTYNSWFVGTIMTMLMCLGNCCCYVFVDVLSGSNMLSCFGCT